MQAIGYKELFDLNEIECMKIVENDLSDTQDEIESKSADVRAKLNAINYETRELNISVSEYNKTMELYGKEQLTLNENEYVVYYDEKDAEKYYNSIPAEGKNITILGKELTPADNWCRKGTILLAPFPFNDGIIVVPDNTVSENNVIQSIMIGSYGKKTKAEKRLAEVKWIKITTT